MEQRLMKNCSRLAAGAVALGLLGVHAFAMVPPDKAERLGGELTPIGAERAGNADGTIPEWTGGITEPPKGLNYQVGDHHPDPFAEDDIVATITPANIEEFADKVMEGHEALLKRYDSYFMNVYPTHRSCAYPEHVYDATKRNALTAKITESGVGFTGATVGFPFPIPNSGLEAMWNHLVRYRGERLSRTFASIAPTPQGDYTEIVVKDDVIFGYTDPELEKVEDLDNVMLKYVQEVTAPARRAGQMLLVHETIEPEEGPRRSWEYTLGTRRVQRTTQVAYDATQLYSDGMSTADNFDVFSGSPDRYEWTLAGKTEIYIPYNSYELSSPEHTYSDIALAKHLNQDLIRYELHRVWVVEGTIKEGQRHLYKRRINYIDEDSWNIAATELYDERDELYRVQEAHIMNYYDVPTCFNASDIVYDLRAARYVVQNLKNEEGPINFNPSGLYESDFTPSGLRRRGTR